MLVGVKTSPRRITPWGTEFVAVIAKRGGNDDRKTRSGNHKRGKSERILLDGQGCQSTLWQYEERPFHKRKRG